ncbi:MAG: sigma-70 family RNA polymerase sigma factor [Planctomycetota bacterium]|nr:sigma-70 family RNA polymerase sigma factor [Planctomycetota bacterium]
MIRFGQDDSKAVNAAAAVFREHGAFIRTIIRFQAGSEFQEDELAQQLFLSLVNAPIPEDVENVRSYLYQAIANDVIDLGRRKARQRKHFRKFAEEFRISIHKQAPADALMGEEESNAAFACLTRQLSSREAEAVKLRYQDDRSIPEIARIMGVDRRTVSRYLTAALKQLRRILAIE